MPSKMRLVLDTAGIGRVLVSSEVRGIITAATERVAAAAGEGFSSSVYQGRDRIRGMVWAATPEAKRKEATERTLTRAFGAVGG